MDREFLRVTFQLGQVVERIDAAEFAGVDQKVPPRRGRELFSLAVTSLR
jgi:hypothetical protein